MQPGREDDVLRERGQVTAAGQDGRRDERRVPHPDRAERADRQVLQQVVKPVDQRQHRLSQADQACPGPLGDASGRELAVGGLRRAR